jgi:hypothetical protein
MSPKLKKIIGAVKLPENFNEEKELISYFEKKHLFCPCLLNSFLTFFRKRKLFS